MATEDKVVPGMVLGTRPRTPQAHRRKRQAFLQAIRVGTPAEVTTLVFNPHVVGLNRSTPEGDYPLHLACRRGNAAVARVLIQNGAKLGVRDKLENQPVHLACVYGHVPILQVMIDAVADLTATDRVGRTPLHLACEYGYIKLVHLLMEAMVDVNVTDNAGHSTLHSATMFGNPRCLGAIVAKSTLLNAKTLRDSLSALHYAAVGGSIECVHLLLKQGADADIRDKRRMSPMHYAACFGFTNIVYAMVRNAGCSVNCVDAAGRTPLHAAMAYGHRATAELLIGHGARLEMPTAETGETPLHWAARWGYLPGVVYLVKHGAHMAMVNKDGETPDQVAAGLGRTREASKLFLLTKKDRLPEHPSLRHTRSEGGGLTLAAATAADAEEDDGSFLAELRSRKKLAVRGAFVDKASTRRVHPKAAVLRDLEPEAIVELERSPSPVKAKGFHLSSVVRRDAVQWQWQRDDGTYQRFSTSSSRQLEKRFRQGRPFARINRDGVSYDVIFGLLVQVDMDGANVGYERCLRRLLPGSGIRASWQQQYQPLVLVDVPPLSYDHMEVSQRFFTNPDYGPSKASHRITRIQRIQDVRRAVVYDAKRKAMLAALGERRLNEQLLFRDVNRFPPLEEQLAAGEEPPMVAVEKFEHGALFSKGWYFAENTRYCIGKYGVPCTPQGEQRVLAVRTLLGRVRPFGLETRRAMDLVSGEHAVTDFGFHSARGGPHRALLFGPGEPDDSRLFAVYDEGQYYPEFIVSFLRIGPDVPHGFME